MKGYYLKLKEENFFDPFHQGEDTIYTNKKEAVKALKHWNKVWEVNYDEKDAFQLVRIEAQVIHE